MINILLYFTWLTLVMAWLTEAYIFSCPTPSVSLLMYEDIISGEVMEAGEQLRHLHQYRYHCRDNSSVSRHFTFLECNIGDVYGMTDETKERLTVENWPYCLVQQCMVPIRRDLLYIQQNRQIERELRTLSMGRTYKLACNKGFTMIPPVISVRCFDDRHYKMTDEDGFTLINRLNLHRTFPICRDLRCPTGPPMWPMQVRPYILLAHGEHSPLRCEDHMTIHNSAYVTCINKQIVKHYNNSNSVRCTRARPEITCSQPMQPGVELFEGIYAVGAITTLACPQPGYVRGPLLRCTDQGRWQPLQSNEWPSCVSQRPAYKRS